MRITFEISDDLVPSLQEYIDRQFKVDNDPLTNTQRYTKIYADVTTFLQDVVHQTVEQVVRQHPTVAIREQLKQVAALNESIKAAAKPKAV